MLDTGAQPSVVDRTTLERMNQGYSERQGEVYGIGKFPISICGTEVEVDIGAQPSVVDRTTLERMNQGYSERQGEVYGIGKFPISICGTEVEVDVGDGQIMNHRLEVLNTSVRIAVLGRNFLANFHEVCFDLKGFRVRLDSYWKEEGG